MKSKPPGKPALRRCAGCFEMKDKRELLRVVRTETGFTLDETGKKNGRGAYVCKNQDCFKKAFKQKGLERSFKQAVPAEVYEELKEKLNSE